MDAERASGMPTPSLRAGAFVRACVHGAPHRASSARPHVTAGGSRLTQRAAMYAPPPWPRSRATRSAPACIHRVGSTVRPGGACAAGAQDCRQACMYVNRVKSPGTGRVLVNRIRTDLAHDVGVVINLQHILMAARAHGRGHMRQAPIPLHACAQPASQPRAQQHVPFIGGSTKQRAQLSWALTMAVLDHGSSLTTAVLDHGAVRYGPNVQSKCRCAGGT